MKHKIINIILTLIFLSGCEFSDENREGETMADIQYYIDPLATSSPILNIKTYDNQFIIDYSFNSGIAKGDADVNPTILLKQYVLNHNPLTLQGDKIRIKRILKNESFTFVNDSNKIITQSGRNNLFADIPFLYYLKIGAGAKFQNSLKFITYVNEFNDDMNRYSNYLPVEVYQQNYEPDTILHNAGVEGGFDLFFHFGLYDLYENSLFTRTQAGIYPATAFELVSFNIRFQIIGEIIR